MNKTEIENIHNWQLQQELMGSDQNNKQIKTEASL